MPHTIVQQHPLISDIQVAQSLHVLTFSSKGELLLVESEGRLDVNQLGIITDRARDACFGDQGATLANGEGRESLYDRMKHAVEEKVRNKERWKEG